MDSKNRERFIGIARYTVKTLEHIIKTASPKDLTTLRDGEEGWTVLEVLCHLRDFDEIFMARATSMIEQDNPHFAAYDHEAMVAERRYSEQNPQEVLESLSQHRATFLAFFEGLTEEQWQRFGTHPERGHFTLFDSVGQVGFHDSNHIEQITRILARY